MPNTFTHLLTKPRIATNYAREDHKHGIAAGAVTSAMIQDGEIANADISAAAAIADTKLATLSTAGKVADSALSVTVTKGSGAALDQSD